MQRTLGITAGCNDEEEKTCFNSSSQLNTDCGQWNVVVTNIAHGWKWCNTKGPYNPKKGRAGGTQKCKSWGWSSYFLGVKVNDLIQLRVTLRETTDQAVAILLGYKSWEKYHKNYTLFRKGYLLGDSFLNFSRSPSPLLNWSLQPFPGHTKTGKRKCKQSQLHSLCLGFFLFI